MRSNIDTFDKYTDQQVWEALDRVGMGAQLRESELKLQTVVESGGSNFSVGAYRDSHALRLVLQ